MPRRGPGVQTPTHILIIKDPILFVSKPGLWVEGFLQWHWVWDGRVNRGVPTYETEQMLGSGQTAYINQAAVMKEVRGLLDYGSLRYALQQEP